MKRLFFALLVIVTFSAFKTIYDLRKNSAEVDQVQGVYIFSNSKPVSEFEYLGKVKGPAVASSEFGDMVQYMSKRAKEQFPNCNAIIFDGDIKASHNTSVSAVLIK